jgi:hypothetical protein
LVARAARRGAVMATIAGSQFNAGDGPTTVNVGFDSNGSLPAPVGSDFNLAIFVGSDANAPSFSTVQGLGYQGLAVQAPGGYELDLIGGSFAVTDNGTGGDTLVADGTGETVSGGGAFVNLTLNGSNNTANGGTGPGFIQVNGTGNTVNTGAGPQVVNVNTAGNTVNVDSGNNVISILANNTTVNGGAAASGADTITATGNGENITAGTGPDLINATGTGTILTGGSGNDTLNVFGNGDTITGGSGTDVLGAYANDVSVMGGSGPSTVYATGVGDTVTAGTGNMTLYATGSNLQFNDNSSAVYNDTVVGFSNSGTDTIKLAGGDTVATSALVNSGQDTLVTLSDHSTILLKGVTDIAGLIN